MFVNAVSLFASSSLMIPEFLSRLVAAAPKGNPEKSPNTNINAPSGDKSNIFPKNFPAFPEKSEPNPLCASISPAQIKQKRGNATEKNAIFKENLTDSATFSGYISEKTIIISDKKITATRPYNSLFLIYRHLSLHIN